MSFLAGLAGGAASGLIGLYGQRQSDQWNRKSAELSWANNAREAEIARAHQQDMYNQSIYHYKRRHQYAVKDLRKAGINPILSATYGGGAQPGQVLSSPQASGSPAGDSKNSALIAAQAAANIAETYSRI